METLLLVVEVEQCTAIRPSAQLRGKREHYDQASSKLRAQVEQLSSSLGCQTCVSVSVEQRKNVHWHQT